MLAGHVLGTTRIFNHHVHVAYYWLALAEALLFFGACYLGTYLYYVPQSEDLQSHLDDLGLRASVFAGMTVIAMFSLGLYQPRLREGMNGIAVRTAGAMGLMTLGMTAVFYFVPSLHLWRGVFIYASVFSFIGVMLVRVLFSHTAEMDQLKRKVLVLGSGNSANTIACKMKRKADRRGFRIHGYVRQAGEETSVETGNVLTLNQPLSEYVREHGIHKVVVALDDRRQHIPAEELMRCRMDGVEVLDVLDFFEQEASKILIEHAHPEWFIFSSGFKGSAAMGIGKRAFDIFAAFLLLMGTWPIMLLTILAIWWEDGIGAPVIFRQRRVGLHGRIFEVMKFRSMTVDAEGDGKARWATPGDPRVTRVGRIIRKLRIDELPQIINVLAGDMAFVGPRPERPEFVRDLAQRIPHFEKRHCVKPGITGWAQLNYPYGASEEDAKYKLEFDLYYVKNQSLFLDLNVLLQTVEVILFGKGAR